MILSNRAGKKSRFNKEQIDSVLLSSLRKKTHLNKILLVGSLLFEGY